MLASLMLASAACAPLRGIARADRLGPDDEAARTREIAELGIRIKLGAVVPLVRKGEHGIFGGNPDGPMSADTVGPVTKIFFTCWDGREQLSCLSQNSSIDEFSGLSHLYREPDSGRFRTIMKGATPGDPHEDVYAAIQSTWRDPETGIIHAWYHAEVSASREASCGATYASVGYATSTDDGFHFEKRGIVLTSPYPIDYDVCAGQGVQGPSVVQSGGRLYMYFTIGNTRKTELGGIGVAMASTAAPGEWRYYHEGTFSQPGIGGQVTPVIPRGGANGDLWSPTASWNKYLQKYILLHSNYHNEGAVYLRVSDDLIAWSRPYMVMSASRRYSYRYPTLFGATDDVTRERGWLYFGRTPRTGTIGKDTLLARREFVLEKIE